MKANWAIFLALSVAILFSGFAYSATTTQIGTEIPALGRVLSVQALTLGSSPNPSKVGQTITLTGALKDNSNQPLPNTSVLLYYSYDFQKWNYISTAITGSTGIFSFQWKPTLNGRIYIRASAGGAASSLEHVVATFIVASDGSDDFTDIQTAINALPQSGGTIYVRNGIYTLSRSLSITNRSNILLIGEGYNTELTKSSGLILRMENVSSVAIRKLHFHHLSNNNYEAISVRGINDGITIADNWITRDQGPLQNMIDLVFFNPNSTTTNLQIRNNFLQYAQIDALAIKKVNGGIIQNNTILDTATNVITGLGSGMTIEESSNIVVTGNYIERTGNHSMGGVNIFGNSKNIKVEKNTIINVQWGVNLNQVSSILIDGNEIVDPFSSGIRVESSLNVTASNNLIEQSKYDRELPGIYTVNNDNITAYGNTIKNMGSGIMLYNDKWADVGFNMIDLGAQTFKLQQYGVHVYNSTNSQIYNNTILRAYDVGLAVSMSTWTTITGNVISNNQRSGIRLSSSDRSTITQNTLKDNGQDTSATEQRDGVDIISSHYCDFEKNRVFDDQPAKTQLVGLVESGTSDYNAVINNDFRWNALQAMKIVGSHTITLGNLI